MPLEYVFKGIFILAKFRKKVHGARRGGGAIPNIIGLAK
jgi:hypothetical protein